MIDPAHKLPVRRQAKLLGLSHSSVNYRPAPAPESDMVLMRRMDEFIRRIADASRHAARRKPQDRAQARRHADDATT